MLNRKALRRSVRTEKLEDRMLMYGGDVLENDFSRLAIRRT